MSKCWSCGSDLAGGLHHSLTCPQCRGVEELKGISGSLESSGSQILEGLEDISAEIANIGSILEWRFDRTEWRLDQMKGILKGIDSTLKTPGATQADEWRQIAEKLSNKGILDESEKFFLKSLEMYPLDYRAYVGLGKIYLRMGKGDKAREYWGKSLPHAPKGEEINYKSYSHRLIGRLDFCEGNIQRAASTLQKAIKLSPNYCLGYYDYAQYSLLLGDKKECILSLVVVMEKKPALLGLAGKEKNLKEVEKEVRVLLQAAKYMKEAHQGVKQAMVFFKIGHKEYFDDSTFSILKDLNPFSRFCDNLFKFKRAMDENYKLARRAAYKASPNRIFANDSSIANYLEKVHSLASQTTEPARQIVDLVRKKYPS